MPATAAASVYGHARATQTRDLHLNKKKNYSKKELAVTFFFLTNRLLKKAETLKLNCHQRSVGQYGSIKINKIKTKVNTPLERNRKVLTVSSRFLIFYLKKITNSCYVRA